ncbi:MAG: hypothetical protein OES57_17710 [Acidimicrobiia bacterium]|nr:hypothetical protein [Acidimicrobiia bacterium]
MNQHSAMPLRRRAVVPLMVAAVAVVALLAPLPVTAHDGSSGDVEIARGVFSTLEGGEQLGFDIDGRAMMVRLPHHTLVHVRVNGLAAKTTYPAHVHDGPCSADPPGGVHYQHKPGDGPRFVNDVNEIWPEITTNGRGGAHAHAAHGHRARPDARSVVIHYPEDTSIRLACADLR